jgi:primary-amine oxidase
MSGREVNHAAHRHWVVSSSSRRNRHGHPTAYRLMPAHELVPFAHPRSSVMQRANFLSKAVWVTRTHPDEKWASGKYPNQRKGPDGPAEWSKKNRDLTDKEITIWSAAAPLARPRSPPRARARARARPDPLARAPRRYTFGTTHIVRPEQWPIMPTDRISFVLEPYGFFDANPTLDVPPSKPEALPPRPKL